MTVEPVHPAADFLKVLWAALEHSTAATCVTTAQLDLPGPEIVYVNPAYCRMTGYQRHQVLGNTPRIMQGPLTSRHELDRLRDTLTRGDSFVGETVNYRQGGDPFLIQWRVDPVHDHSGRCTHYIATQSDITEIRRSRTLIETTHAIDTHLNQLLDTPDSAQANLDSLAQVAREAMATVVGFGQVYVVSSIRLGTSEIVSQPLDDPTPTTAATPRADHGGRPSSARSPSIEWTATADQHTLQCRAHSLEDGVVCVVAISPITADQRAFIDTCGIGYLLERIVSALISLARYERHREVAIELQRRLLPPNLPTVGGFTMAAQYHPGAFGTRVGGDWYDVIDQGPDQATVGVIGDLAGSGVSAAAEMGQLRLLTRQLLQQEPAIDRVFTLLNQFCLEHRLVATLAAASFDQHHDRLAIYSAGHPPPVLITPNGVVTSPVTPSPVLGVWGDHPYVPATIPLTQVTGVVLYTDGLMEDANVAPTTAIADLATEIARYRGPDNQLAKWLVQRRTADDAPNDDIAVLVVHHRRQPNDTKADP